MKDFIDCIFGSEILIGTSCNEITDTERQQIVNSMMMIVFSHRYSKGDKFILESEACSNNQKNTPIDFTIVRDTMYKYSKKA